MGKDIGKGKGKGERLGMECLTCSFGLLPSLRKEMLTVESGSPLSRSRACRYRHSGRRRGKTQHTAHTNKPPRIQAHKTPLITFTTHTSAYLVQHMKHMQANTTHTSAYNI